MPSFRSRKFQVYLAYSHADRDLVHWLADWMRKAEIDVWLDKINLRENAPVATELSKQIRQCQGFLLFASKTSLESSWVKQEIELALHEDVENPAFAFTVCKIDDVDIPSTASVLRNKNWIEANPSDNRFDLQTVVRLVNSIFNRQPSSISSTQNWTDVYVSRSDNNEKEGKEANAVCRQLLDYPRLRLVGDALDQENFDLDRIKAIMAGCSGHAIILPERHDASKYKYFMKELEASLELNVIALVLHPPGCPLPDTVNNAQYVAEFGKADEVIHEFISDVRAARPAQDPSAFYAHEYQSNQVRNRAASDLIGTITGQACRIGSDFTGSLGTGQILEGITESSWFLVDLASQLNEEKRLKVNLNSCIEAGIAIGLGFGKPNPDRKFAQRAIHAICLDRLENISDDDRGKTYDLPFMLRSTVPIEFYKDDYDFLALIHRVARKHRRRIINDEL